MRFGEPLTQALGSCDLRQRHERLRIAGGPGFVAGPIERAFRDARAGLINPPLDDVAYQAFASALIESVRQPEQATVAPRATNLG